MLLIESQGHTLDGWGVELRISRAYDSGNFATYQAELLTTDGALTSAQLGVLPKCDLQQVASDVRGYGRRLAQWVFQGTVGEAFADACVGTKVGTTPTGPGTLWSPPSTVARRSGLRLRLWLEPQADELHGIWWEAIRDPAGDDPLATSLAFSRYWRGSRPRGTTVRERPLRMLLIACNPSGLDALGLKPIDVSLALSIIKDATLPLAWMLDVDRLVGHVTLGQAQERMMRGYHIAHLLLHVDSDQDQSRLVFADPGGEPDPVPGLEVARSICGSGRPPFLVFLATPLEALPAGDEACRTPVALAPMFVQQGAHAAVAMQAAVGIKNLQRFTQRFYAVLARTGMVDLAMALARAEIYEEGDWEWTYPVLCMCTPDAKLFQPLPETLERAVRGVSVTP